MRKEGFTLIEILMVLAALSLVLGLAFPLLHVHVKDARLHQSARNVMQMMRYAQYRAVSDRLMTSFWLDTDENSIQIVRPGEEADEWLPISGDWSEPRKLEAPIRISPDSEIMTYYPDGSNTGGVLILEGESKIAKIQVKPGIGRMELSVANRKI